MATPEGVVTITALRLPRYRLKRVKHAIEEAEIAGLQRVAGAAMKGAEVGPHRARSRGELAQDDRQLGRLVLGDEVERVALERADTNEKDHAALSRRGGGVDVVELVRGI
jgi:hypothetical protein